MVKIGNTLQAARPFGELNRTARASLSLRDPIDFGRISPSVKSSFNLAIDGIGKRSIAHVALFNSAGRVIRAPNNRGNKAETLNNITLEAGIFYVGVRLQPHSANTSGTEIDNGSFYQSQQGQQ